MLIHRISTRCMVILMSVQLSAYCSENKQKLQPLVSWDLTLFLDPFQFDPSYRDSSKLDEILSESLTITREEALRAKLSYKRLFILDYLFVLQKTQARLLTKSFETWTIQDFDKIARWMTRLLHEEPGSYRRCEKNYQYKDSDTYPNEDLLKLIRIEERVLYQRASSHEKVKRLRELKERGALRLIAGNQGIVRYLLSPLQEHETKFYESALFLHTAPKNIEEEFKKAIEEAQKCFREIKTIDDAFSVASKIHYELVRIFPYEAMNKYIGKVVMDCILMQNGIQAYSLPLSSEYNATIKECLQKKTSVPLMQYVKRNIKEKNPDYEKKQNPHDLTVVPLTCTVQEAVSLLGDAYRCAEELTNADITVRQCNTCSNKTFELLKLCGGCKKVYYCSPECQRGDWKKHKITCKLSK